MLSWIHNTCFATIIAFRFTVVPLTGRLNICQTLSFRPTPTHSHLHVPSHLLDTLPSRSKMRSITLLAVLTLFPVALAAPFNPVHGRLARVLQHRGAQNDSQTSLCALPPRLRYRLIMTSLQLWINRRFKPASKKTDSRTRTMVKSRR
jgi:hypothetical protein